MSKQICNAMGEDTWETLIYHSQHSQHAYQSTEINYNSCLMNAVERNNFAKFQTDVVDNELTYTAFKGEMFASHQTTT